jgi:hypothetical protein
MKYAYTPGDGERWDEDRQRMISDFYQHRYKPADLPTNGYYEGDEWMGAEAERDAFFMQKGMPVSPYEGQFIELEEELRTASDYIDDLEQELDTTIEENNDRARSLSRRASLPIAGAMVATIAAVVAIIGSYLERQKHHEVRQNLNDARLELIRGDAERRSLLRERDIYRDLLRELTSQSLVDHSESEVQRSLPKSDD